MKVEQWKIGDVKPYEHNPRINDSAVDAVATSIQEFGICQPIVVGHTRYKAAQKLNLETVPVHVAKVFSLWRVEIESVPTRFRRMFGIGPSGELSRSAFVEPMQFRDLRHDRHLRHFTGITGWICVTASNGCVIGVPFASSPSDATASLRTGLYRVCLCHDGRDANDAKSVTVSAAKHASRV